MQKKEELRKRNKANERFFEVIENLVRQTLFVSLLVTIAMSTVGSDSYRQTENVTSRTILKVFCTVKV